MREEKLERRERKLHSGRFFVSFVSSASFWCEPFVTEFRGGIQGTEREEERKGGVGIGVGRGNTILE